MKAPLIGDNVYKKNFDAQNLPQVIRKNIEKNSFFQKDKPYTPKQLVFFTQKKKNLCFLNQKYPMISVVY